MEQRQALRIALVAPLWAGIPPATYGGIELVIKLLVDELVGRGHLVTLFAAGGSDTAAQLHAVCPDNLLAMMSDGRAADYECYAAANLAEAFLRQEEFDVIHIHLGNQWIPLGAVAKTPVLFTLHTQLGPDDRWVMARYSQVPVSALSHFQVKSFIERNPREIPVVYNGCDMSAFEPSYERGGYLAFLGRMSYDKNPLGAIRIAKKTGMPLIIAGTAQSAKEEKYFQKEIKPLIDGEQIRYIGAVNHKQKNRLLRGASALLFPVQWEEPFGLVMIEAMACGTPVIGHRLGSVGEVVENGVTGYHGDSIETMHELVPQTLALDRAGVRARVVERFSHQRMVDDYLRLYGSLIASKRA